VSAKLTFDPVGTYRKHQYFVTYRRILDSQNLQLSINGIFNLLGFGKVRSPFREFLMQEFLLLIPTVCSGLAGPSSWEVWARRYEPDQFLISLRPASKEFCGRTCAVGAPFIDCRPVFIILPGFTQPLIASDAEGCGGAFSFIVSSPLQRWKVKQLNTPSSVSIINLYPSLPLPSVIYTQCPGIGNSEIVSINAVASTVKSTGIVS